jgi:hypothetical protein
MGEVVFKGKFEVDADCGLTYAREGDFRGGWVAGDNGCEGGLVETEVRFSLGERMGGHKEKAVGGRGVAPQLAVGNDPHRTTRHLHIEPPHCQQVAWSLESFD